MARRKLNIANRNVSGVKIQRSQSLIANKFPTVFNKNRATIIHIPD